MRGTTVARTLVLYAYYTDRLSYYDDWLDAFETSPLYDVRAINICKRGARKAVATALGQVDLVILLHSTNGDTTMYLEPFAPLLADRSSPLISFIGNEVNLPGSPIADKRRVLRTIQPDWIATQLLAEAGFHLWGDLAGRGVLSVPHALNPEAFRPGPRQDRRTVDIGVRAVRYLPHLGDRDRNAVHDLFASHAFAPELTVDIGTGRFDREGWASFLASCKGTVSSEAGSWWLEHDDATVEAIRRWTVEHNRRQGLIIANDSPLRKLGHKLPWWVRSLARYALRHGPVRHESTVNENLPFDEIWNRFFSGRSRPHYYGKCISSRHFDAIGTGTVQILLEGRYNDILKAGTHYIELAPDLSNIQSVMETFRDPGYRQRLADAALEHTMAHHTYAHRVASLHHAVTKS